MDQELEYRPQMVAPRCRSMLLDQIHTCVVLKEKTLYYYIQSNFLIHRDDINNSAVLFYTLSQNILCLTVPREYFTTGG